MFRRFLGEANTLAMRGSHATKDMRTRYEIFRRPGMVALPPCGPVHGRALIPERHLASLGKGLPIR